MLFRRYHIFIGSRSQLDVEFRCSDSNDTQVAIDGNVVTVGQLVYEIDNSVDAGYPEFAGDNRSVDQHPATTFDNSGRQRHEVCHHGLYRITHENLARANPRQRIRGL